MQEQMMYISKCFKAKCEYADVNHLNNKPQSF